MCFTVGIDFLEQFLGVSFRRNRNLLLDFLVFVGVGFDVCSVDEHRFGIQISFVGDLIENPVEDFVNGFFIEAMAEVVAQGRKMRRRFVDGIA